MKGTNILLVFLIVLGYSVSAQISESGGVRMDFIQADIQRIDKLDGKEDHKLQTGDSINDIIAYHAFLIWPDSIDRYIRTADFNETDKRIYRDYLFRTMRRVYGKNYKNARYFDGLFAQMYKEVKAIHDSTLYEVMCQNAPMAIQTVGLYRYQAVADSFLCFAAKSNPDAIFECLDEFSDRQYAQHVVEYTTKCAPQLAKKYFLEKDPVMKMLKLSNDTAIKILLRINSRIGKKSNAFVLIDDIVKGKLTIKQADSIAVSGKSYLTALMKIRKQRRPLGAYSVDKELEVQALKFVRKINDLHNEQDAVRYKAVDAFTADQLYTLIVYSEEEVFTSTFNGLYKRFMLKLGKRDGFEFLRSMGENRFRIFIKQCASFGKLDNFLLKVAANKRTILLVKFAAALDKDEYDISEAVEVADAYTSIKDTAVQMILEKTAVMELERMTEEKNKKGLAIYGLLSNLFVRKGSIFRENWYQNLSDKYKLPSLDVLPSEKLFAANKKCVWHMYFYDDDDGAASFKAFLDIFRDASWTIDERSKLFVKIKSKVGKSVEIYANKPKAEYEGQTYLEHYFDSLNITPDVLIHRGHSYYAYKTIQKTKPGTKIFVLGSCGGYHNLSGIIDKSPEVNIISSKQIGTYAVNNPILKELAENVRKGTDVNWQDLWKKVDARLKNSKDYPRFLDYIPPHKNLGAIFIRAYYKLMDEN